MVIAPVDAIADADLGQIRPRSDTLLGENVMEVEEMVDAALVGLDRGERVTIPGLADPAYWDTYLAARTTLYANMPARHAAARYR